MIPPIATHQQLVLMERAVALARAEKSRSVRDQEQSHVAHIESKAGQAVGLDSFRGRTGRLVIRAGTVIAGRERIDSRAGAPRVATAHR